MHPSRRFGPFLLALPLLASCAGEPPAGPRATTIAQYDGNYIGRATLVRGAYPACPRSSRGVLEVGDGTLVHDYVPQLVFNVPVQPDGSLHAKVGAAALDGRIAGNQLDMVVTIPGCETRYSAHYVWNRS